MRGSTRHQPPPTRSRMRPAWSRTSGRWSCQQCRSQRALQLQDRSHFVHRRRQGHMSSSRKSRRRSKTRGCSCTQGRQCIRGKTRTHKNHLLLWRQQRSCMHQLPDIRRFLHSRAHRRRLNPHRRSHQVHQGWQPQRQHLWCCTPHIRPMAPRQAASQSHPPRSCRRLGPGCPKSRARRTPRRRRRR